MRLTEQQQSRWARALASADVEQIDAIVKESGRLSIPDLEDVAASVAGCLTERVLSLLGHDHASVVARSDKELATLVLGPLERQRSIGSRERRAILKCTGPILRDWRRIEGLWRGGGQTDWLFGYLIPSGVIALRGQGLLDVDEFVRYWEDSTRSDPRS